MEADSHGTPTGKFRTKRPLEEMKPRGSWPENWLDMVHGFDGHDIEANPSYHDGEERLARHLSDLYIQHAVEHAHDGVSWAVLGPDLARARRDVEMGFFKTMDEGQDRRDQADRHKQGRLQSSCDRMSPCREGISHAA